MMATPDATHEATPGSVPTSIGRPLIRFDQVTSTMDVAVALAALGAPEGTTVQADLQTAGRGRAGRRWDAEAGSALMLSIILRPRVSAPRLGLVSLLAGLAVANVAEALTCRPAMIKWPNDVLIDGRKVAGVLLQSRIMTGTNDGWLILGVGINVGSTPATCNAVATSLAEAASDVVPVPTVLNRLIVELQDVYRRFTSDALDEAWGQLNDRLAYRDREVTIVDGECSIRGIVTGIGDSGELLLLRSDGTIHSVVSGELARGPLPIPT